MSRALLRFDVSPSIGAGHMVRCLALGTELELRGYDTMCAVNSNGLHMLPEAWRRRAASLSGEYRQASSILQQCPGMFDLVVVDHYQLDAAWETGLRSIGSSIVAIDDLADRRHSADLLIDSAPGQTAGRYQTLLQCPCLCLMGADYALLRKEFVIAREAAGIRSFGNRLRILVSLGATDPDNVTERVLDALFEMHEVELVTVVLGVAAPHKSAVARSLSRFGSRGRLAEDPTSMSQLIIEHDVAIGAPGMSALERACLGISQLLLLTARNQELVRDGLVASGAAISLGDARSCAAGEIATGLRRIISDDGILRSQSAAGMALVDGRGAARAAAIITKGPKDKRGARLRARTIRRDDSEMLLRWQSHPETRVYSRSSRIPSRADHASFMSKRLSETQLVSEILLKEEEPVAIVRADPVPGGREVSIVTAPEHRGSGIGAAALSYLDGLLISDDLIAVVDPRNAASVATFQQAGYRQSGKRRLILETLGDAEPGSIRAQS